MLMMLFQELEGKHKKFYKRRRYKKEVVAKAEGEASRFLAIYNEYKNAKSVPKKECI